MNTLPLPIEIEGFLAWQANMFFKIENPAKTNFTDPFVSLTWEFGCEGVPLANLVARRLNQSAPEPTPWVVVDKNVVETITEKYGVAAKFIEALTHARRSHIEQTVETLLGHQPTDYQVFEILAKTILSLAEVGHVIILDLGTPIVCENEPRGIHIRLVAPRSWREKRVERERGLGLRETQALLRKEDEEQESYVREFTGKKIGDPKYYDAVFNNAKCSVETIANFVEAAVLKKIKAPYR